MRVYIKSYDAEINVPITVVSGRDIKNIVKLYEAIGFDSKMMLTVSSEEEIETFAEHYCLFYCNKFVPSLDFEKKHKGIFKFIICDSQEGSWSMVGETLDATSFYSFNNLKENLDQLAKLTGIDAFRNLVYDADKDLWVNLGKTSVRKQHSTAELGLRFSAEIAKWVAAGSPLRSPSVIKALYDTFCSKCTEFIKGKKPDRGKCNLCGCNINLNQTMFNKLGMATTSCPASPPKWTTEIAVNEEAIKGREVELFDEYVRIQKEQFPNQTGESCDCK